jgi:beta-glucosidase
LSYTTFEYGKPLADKNKITSGYTITISVKVKNTDAREGQEIV